MFYEWYGDGLGDTKKPCCASCGGLGDANCLATVKTYANDYVFAGARVTFTFTGHITGFPFNQFFRDAKSEIQNAVASRGYSNVSALISSPLLGDSAVTVTATVPIDQAHSNDVLGNFKAAISALGIRISSENLQVSNPTYEQICGSSGNPTGPGSSTGSINPGALGTAKSYVDSLANTLGVSTPILLGGVIAAFVLLKR